MEKNTPISSSRVPAKVIYPFRQKLLKTFLPITLAPLAVLSLIGASLIHRQSTQQANIKLHERSVYAAELTHQQITDTFALLRVIATDPRTQVTLRTATQAAEAEDLHRQPIEQVETKFAATKVLPTQSDLVDYLQSIATIGGFAELFMTERHGFNVAYSQITSDFVQSDEAWWQLVRDQGRWMDAPDYDESSQATTVDLLYAVHDNETQEFLGVIKGGYNVENLNILASELENLHLGKSENLQIVRLAATPDDQSQVVLTITDQGQHDQNDLLISERLLQQAIAEMPKGTDQPDHNHPGTFTSTVEVAYIQHDNHRYNIARVPETDWLIISSADMGEIYALGRQWMLIFGSSLLVLGAASWFLVLRLARQHTAPLSELADVTQQVIAEADFSLRMPIESQDEVGVLAAALNQLLEWTDSHTQALRLTQESLEERTQKLSQTLNELNKAQFQLIQTEKMSALGQLVAGVAHEINNPVNFIYGNIAHAKNYSLSLIDLVEMYQAEFPQTSIELQEEVEELELDFLKEDLTKLLDSMKLGADRIRDIVKSLRLFSRLDEAECKEADVHEGIDSTLMILHNRLKAKPDHPEIQVIKEYGDLPKIECYAGQLNQVFMNLLSNAIDALDEYNKKRSFAAIKADPSKLWIRTQNLGNGKVTISIRDNGIGISDSALSKLFEPFYTTKEIGQGTGLGLSISHQIIIDQHHGRLSCHSQPGEWTEFVIELPIRQTVRGSNSLLPAAITSN